MRVKDINAAGFAWLGTDSVKRIVHFDCGGGERYTLPEGAVYCDSMLPGYKYWVARIESVRRAASAR